MRQEFLIYGATGYTGGLIAREAARRGLRPVLAGRNRAALESLAAELELPLRIFGLDDPDVIIENIAGAALVLHCAGPFIHTWRAMTEACLAAGTHYVDLTGEVPVLEAIYALDGRARERGVVLLPGAGLDVVPSDCLALKLKEALPDADRLRLTLDPGRKQSRGTMKASIEAIPRGGAYRKDGILIWEKQLGAVRRLPIGAGRKSAMRIPWGDISSAYRSTGIPNIEVFVAGSAMEILFLRSLRPITPLLKHASVERLAMRIVDRFTRGPSADYRARARARFRGDVWNAAGEHRVASLTTPEGYALTTLTALEIVRRILRNGLSPGAHTPSEAFGSGFILEFPGMELTGPNPEVTS